MAKPPPEERFRVICNSVSVNNLGMLMQALTKLGINDVNFDLVTDIRTFNKRTQHDSKAEDFLREWVAEHPTFKAKEVVNAFKADGRTNGAAYTALRVLTEKGTLKKLGEGNYARKDVKALSGPKKKKKNSYRREETPNSAFLLSYAKKNGGKLNRADAAAALNKDGRNGGSISSVIRDMLKASTIERVSEGEYAVIKSKTNSGEQAHGN